MSDATAGQPGPTPDFIPGWFTRRGEPNPEVREAVRWMGGYDFPVGFLRSDEMVHPARPPQLGICIGNARHSEMELAVPPTYWIVRTPAGELRLWTDMDFKARWTRSDREWIPPRDREQPLATPTAMRKLKGESDVRVEAGSSPGSPEAMPAFQRALRGLEEEATADRPRQDAENARQIYAEDPGGGQAYREEIARREADWKGTPPAEGSRRALIFDLLGRELGGFDNERCLELADEIESALLQTTIDDEEAHSSPGVGVPGSAQGEMGKTDFTDQLRYAVPSLAPVHNQLDTIAVPRTAFESGDDGPQSILTLKERVEILVRRYSRAVTANAGSRDVEQALDRLKRIYALAIDTGGPPRQLCDLHADLREIAGIARADYPAEPKPGEIREVDGDPRDSGGPNLDYRAWLGL